MHRRLFLAIVFGFIVSALAWNIYRLTVVYRHQPARRTATEIQDSVFRERHKALQGSEMGESKNKATTP